MRVTLLTLLILLGMSADAQVLLWVLALLPGAGAAMFLGFLLRPAARRKPQRDDRNWRGVHREPAQPGRHAPARGTRLRGLSRQAQLEERTVSVTAAWALQETTEAWQAPEPHEHEPWRDGLRLRCRTCKLDLDQPEGMPEVGQHGFSSWT